LSAKLGVINLKRYTINDQIFGGIKTLASTWSNVSKTTNRSGQITGSWVVEWWRNVNVANLIEFTLSREASVTQRAMCWCVPSVAGQSLEINVAAEFITGFQQRNKYAGMSANIALLHSSRVKRATREASVTRLTAVIWRRATNDLSAECGSTLTDQHQKDTETYGQIKPKVRWSRIQPWSMWSGAVEAASISNTFCALS